MIRPVPPPFIKPGYGIKPSPARLNKLGVGGYWAFQETGGLKLDDLAPYNCPGTLTNAPTWENGPAGSVMRFASASSQYVTMGNLARLGPSSNMSGFCGYNYISGTGFLFGKMTASVGWGLRVTNSTTLRFVSDYNTTDISISPTVTSLGTDYHVSGFTVNADVAQVYHDGKAVGSTGTGSSAVATNTGPFTIGARNGSTEYFNGRIGWVIVAYRPWSDQIIQDLFFDPFFLFREPSPKFFNLGTFMQIVEMSTWSQGITFTSPQVIRAPVINLEGVDIGETITQPTVYLVPTVFLEGVPVSTTITEPEKILNWHSFIQLAGEEIPITFTDPTLYPVYQILFDRMEIGQTFTDPEILNWHQIIQCSGFSGASATFTPFTLQNMLQYIQLAGYAGATISFTSPELYNVRQQSSESDILLYWGEPKEAKYNGVVVSQGDETRPIFTVHLNPWTEQETDPIKLAVRCVEGKRTFSPLEVALDGAETDNPTTTQWALANDDGTGLAPGTFEAWGSALVIDELIAETNTVFWIKARATLDETDNEGKDITVNLYLKVDIGEPVT